ncbi:uncharacterized protein LACBIDRAFT_324310 [Laccaria bicolor S238N-H82]|uniref:Predicted protein n=1 Tax=Laccaria bicolor (strain S238N-H82 / ATCC MYA-4686) TaxID=486041 RepID=B0D1E5_LACBS|nr:uncharacterized protein LACBIDRAFT_324310 [Laccaria bicolor S238N-H82]EDR11620.1 predicted protein [Laccaria bicolor S238N-H82]|eukprot:XP_001877517.1 predicted protein [Laccaria bicolor S238N-H82]
MKNHTFIQKISCGRDSVLSSEYGHSELPLASLTSLTTQDSATELAVTNVMEDWVSGFAPAGALSGYCLSTARSNFLCCPLWLDINTQRKTIDNTTTPNAINRHCLSSTSPLFISHNALLVFDIWGLSGYVLRRHVYFTTRQYDITVVENKETASRNRETATNARVSRCLCLIADEDSLLILVQYDFSDFGHWPEASNLFFRRLSPMLMYPSVKQRTDGGCAKKDVEHRGHARQA